MNTNVHKPANETLPQQYERKRRMRAEFAVKSQTSLIENYVIQSCINCEHWNDKQNVCRYYDALPPPQVIAVGCGMHDFDIPF